MRIVIYTLEFLPFSGGIATYCYELACALRLSGHEVAIVAPKTGEVEIDVPSLRIEWIKVHSMRPVLMLRSIRKLHRVVRDFKPDVLFVMNAYALISASIFRPLLRARIVPILHGSEVLRHSNRRNLLEHLLAYQMQCFYKNRNMIVCGSLYARSLVLNAFPVPPENVVVVYNGMKNRFNPEIHCGASVRRRWNISSASTVLLTVARLVPRKGQDVVIRALPTIIEKHPDIVYICAGHGPYKETLARLTTDHGVSDHVIFPGKIADSEKYAYYDACDLFVMPSRKDGATVEGFGLSFLEAWHTSKPVLGGRHGGVTEVIEDGVDGIIVEPEDVGAIADAILSLVCAPSTLKEMGRRGHAKARQRFSGAIMADHVVRALGRP